MEESNSNRDKRIEANPSAANEESFHQRLYRVIDEYVHYTYTLVRKYPKEELFVTSSQIRRAVVSIMLNYKEGYARKKRLVKINFYEISYGSCKESSYLIDFAFKEGWIDKSEYVRAAKLSNEISSMLWRTIEGLESQPS